LHVYHMLIYCTPFNSLSFDYTDAENLGVIREL
jgi:hypothetical protein